MGNLFQLPTNWLATLRQKNLQAVPNSPMPQSPANLQAIPNAPLSSQVPIAHPMNTNAFYGELPMGNNPASQFTQSIAPVPMNPQNAQVYANKGMSQTDARQWEDFNNFIQKNYKPNRPGTR